MFFIEINGELINLERVEAIYKNINEAGERQVIFVCNNGRSVHTGSKEDVDNVYLSLSRQLKQVSFDFDGTSANEANTPTV
jgi:hypothetical protein